MVEQIENIRSKLEMKTFREKKLPGQRKVHLSQAESRDVVPPFGALLTCGRHRERVRVRRISSWHLLVQYPHRLSGHAVGPWLRAFDWRRNHTVERKTAARHDHDICRPVPQKR